MAADLLTNRRWNQSIVDSSFLRVYDQSCGKSRQLFGRCNISTTRRRADEKPLGAPTDAAGWHQIFSSVWQQQQHARINQPFGIRTARMPSVGKDRWPIESIDTATRQLSRLLPFRAARTDVVTPTSSRPPRKFSNSFKYQMHNSKVTLLDGSNNSAVGSDQWKMSSRVTSREILCAK